MYEKSLEKNEPNEDKNWRDVEQLKWKIAFSLTDFIDAFES